MLDIFIPVKPHPKARPRLGKWGAYTPKATMKAENDIGWIVKEHMIENKIEMTHKDLSIIVNFQMGEDKRRNGDIDNLMKTLFDGLSKVLWNDDRQIIQVSAQKCWGLDEGISLVVREL